jgi:hypothetical protein
MAAVIARPTNALLMMIFMTDSAKKAAPAAH